MSIVDAKPCSEGQLRLKHSKGHLKCNTARDTGRIGNYECHAENHLLQIILKSGGKMKVKQLKVCNIGRIENETVVFEKPLNLFFGEIRSGKTTLAINSLKLLFGGSYSNDILRHGTSAGYVEDCGRKREIS